MASLRRKGDDLMVVSLSQIGRSALCVMDLEDGTRVGLSRREVERDYYWIGNDRIGDVSINRFIRKNPDIERRYEGEMV